MNEGMGRVLYRYGETRERYGVKPGDKANGTDDLLHLT
jgi:hypothetical protein